jgi:hypothetical protein
VIKEFDDFDRRSGSAAGGLKESVLQKTMSGKARRELALSVFERLYLKSRSGLRVWFLPRYPACLGNNRQRLSRVDQRSDRVGDDNVACVVSIHIRAASRVYPRKRKGQVIRVGCSCSGERGSGHGSAADNVLSRQQNPV